MRFTPLHGVLLLSSSHAWSVHRVPPLTHGVPPPSPRTANFPPKCVNSVPLNDPTETPPPNSTVPPGTLKMVMEERLPPRHPLPPLAVLHVRLFPKE